MDFLVLDSERSGESVSLALSKTESWQSGRVHQPQSRKKVQPSARWLIFTLKPSPALSPVPSLIGSLLPRYSTHCRAGGP